MTRIYFYAGPEDNQALRDKIESLGLRLYKAQCADSGMPVEQEPGNFHGYISFQLPEQLQTSRGSEQGGPGIISSTANPVIYWHKSYTVEYEGDRYILHGALSWDFEDDARANEVQAGKRYFGQLSRWIRRNWPPVRKRGTCRGPQAQKMIQFEAYIPRGLPPGLKPTFVEVPGRRRERSATPDPGLAATSTGRDDPAASKARGTSWLSRLLRLLVLPVVLLIAAFLVLVWAESL